MPTTTPLTDAIQALTTYANETTGASDTTLSAAVGTLVAGYGQGGGGEWTTEGIVAGEEPNGDIVLGPNVTKIVSGLGGKPITSFTADYVVSDFPNYGLQNCTQMTYLSMAKFNRTSGNYWFPGCTALTDVRLPSATILRENSFNGCRALVVMDYLNSLTAIAGSAFNNCASLSTLILRNNAVASLWNINAFNGTPFASGKSGGALYVPSSLISSYQSATNWSTILGYANNQILPIEGSIYETQYADGTPIE